MKKDRSYKLDDADFLIRHYSKLLLGQQPQSLAGRIISRLFIAPAGNSKYYVRVCADSLRAKDMLFAPLENIVRSMELPSPDEYLRGPKHQQHNADAQQLR